MQEDFENMKSSKHLSIVLLALLGLTIVPARAFTVDPPEQHRSSFVRLRGPGFGAVQGKVVIGKLPAAIAHWDDNLIECYVPEAAPLGKSQVVVRPRQGLAQTKARMTVLAREELTGRFKWRLKLPDQYVPTRPVVGTDGTVYAMGNFGHIYAVNPDGSLKWVVTPAGGVSGCISLLPNGNLVVGGGGGVQALSFVNGSTLWSFPLQTPLLAGPNVGPDGNVYAADDSRWSQEVIGAFILNANGQLLWSGGKYYRRGGGWTPQEIKFGGGNAYFWSDYSSTGDPNVLGGFNALKQGGGLLWRVEDGVGFSPDALPDGNVALFRPSTIEMRNLSGGTIWSQNLSQFGGLPQMEAVVASDGITYFTTTYATLNAISPAGQVLYKKTIGGIVSNHIVSPDANQIVLQYQPNYGVAAQIQGYDKNANLQWSEELPIEFGVTIVCYQFMEYTPTGDSLYFGTAGPYTGTYEAQCYLYAVDPL
jgi:PQQ-like domain